MFTGRWHGRRLPGGTTLADLADERNMIAAILICYPPVAGIDWQATHKHGTFRRPTAPDGTFVIGFTRSRWPDIEDSERRAVRLAAKQALVGEP